MDSLVKVVPGAQMVTGRRGSADSDIGAVSLGEGDRNLGPKEVLEKRRQKKKRDTAMRHFRNHRTLYETQDERTMRAEITCAALSLDRFFFPPGPRLRRLRRWMCQAPGRRRQRMMWITLNANSSPLPCSMLTTTTTTLPACPAAARIRPCGPRPAGATSRR
jgi:hypothetical protein